MPRGPQRDVSVFFGARKRSKALQLSIGHLFKGTRWLRDRTENFHNWAKYHKLSYMRGVETNWTNFTQIMRPEKDIPHGDKYFSLMSQEPDDYLPDVENPYDDGRFWMCGPGTLLVDLIPFLLHTVDTRISKEAIVSGVVAVSKHADTVGTFMLNIEGWGWMERMEAIGSRIIVQHLRLLCSVIHSQHETLEFRRYLTNHRGILRQSTGDRFYALPGSYQEYI